jgi:hypothetical protein
MKKGWKIALISLGSLLGLVIVAAAVVLWLVFTPSQLTKIVNNLAGKYVTCETHFGRVNLTLFKTFPDAGLTIDDVYVVNPMQGAPSDTVASVGNLTVGVDVKRYLKEKEVVVHQVLLDRVNANLYIDSTGKSNFDIFPHSDDKDTTKSSFSLDSLPDIDLKRVKVSNLDATLRNEQGRMDASVCDLGINIVGTLREGRVDASLDLGSDRIALTTQDSTGASSLDALLEDMKLALKAEGNLDQVAGKLKLSVENGQFNNMVNPTLQASKKDLLAVNIPFDADLGQMRFTFDESRIALDEYVVGLQGMVQLPSDGEPMKVDVAVHNTQKDPWQVAPLLALLPEQFTSWKRGMDVDAKVAFAATAVGDVSDSTLPRIRANVSLTDGRFHYPSALPYRINKIAGDLLAELDLGKNGRSDVTINSLKAHTLHTDVSVSGKVDDLLGDMHVDARVKGSLPLEDVKPMLPDSLPVAADGRATLDLHADLKMSQLKEKAYDKMKADGTINLRNLNVTYDSIHAVAPDLDIALRLPAKTHKGKMAEAHVSGSALNFNMGTIAANVKRPDIKVGINDITREQIAAAFEVALERTNASLDSTSIDLSALTLSGSVRLDSTQTNILKQYNPNLDVDLRQTLIRTNLISEDIYFNNLDFHYSPELCEIADADFKLGNSDLQLYGTVENLEQWLEHKAMLVGDLQLTSNYTDVDQIMDLVSGMGTDKDTLEQMRKEDKVDKEANPFIVPLDVDVTLHTHIKRSLAFGNDLGDLAGAVTVKDGVAILDQIGFVCKAATMQLTALYRSPRPNNLFAAIDFHLLDIQIDELLDMIPVVDTLVPMLAAFNGNADFHLAGESYLFANYKPKMSSLLGSAAISGKNLVVMDNNSIAQIAKLMQFKSWKDNDNKIKIDSLDVEMTCFRKEIEVFPFLLNIGKYQLCASGKHTLDNQCGYHVELLKNPLMAKVGVDVTGSLKSPKISLGQVRYADLYRPEKQGAVEQETLKMKRMIREALEKNVR